MLFHSFNDVLFENIQKASLLVLSSIRWKVTLLSLLKLHEKLHICMFHHLKVIVFAVKLDRSPASGIRQLRVSLWGFLWAFPTETSVMNKWRNQSGRMAGSWWWQTPALWVLRGLTVSLVSVLVWIFCWTWRRRRMQPERLGYGGESCYGDVQPAEWMWV